MKKKMILAAAAVLVSAAGFAGINASSATNPATDLLRENAEILGIDPDEIIEIKCNEAIPDVCFILNKKAVPGERY